MEGGHRCCCCCCCLFCSCSLFALSRCLARTCFFAFNWSNYLFLCVKMVMNDDDDVKWFANELVKGFNWGPPFLESERVFIWGFCNRRSKAQTKPPVGSCFRDAALRASQYVCATLTKTVECWRGRIWLVLFHCKSVGFCSSGLSDPMLFSWFPFH